MAQGNDRSKEMVEQSLDRAVKQIISFCRLAPPEWDLDENLRIAVQEADDLPALETTLKRYDHTIELAKKSGLIIDNKYQFLYKITK